MTVWQSLGGVLNTAVKVVSWSSSANRLDLFARGLDPGFYHNTWNGTWSAWESLRGIILLEPCAVSWGPNRIDAFAVGTTGECFHIRYNGSRSAWEDLGGTLITPPTVISRGPNRLDLFTLGTSQLRYRGVLIDSMCLRSTQRTMPYTTIRGAETRARGRVGCHLVAVPSRRHQVLSLPPRGLSMSLQLG
jgi:hypothetical protein